MIIGGVQVELFGLVKLCFGGEIGQFFKSGINNLKLIWDIFYPFLRNLKNKSISPPKQAFSKPNTSTLTPLLIL